MQDTSLTVQEIAALLKVNTQTVYNWIDSGTLRGIRIGSRRVRVRETELERFIRAGGDLGKDVGEAPDPAAVAREELGEALLTAATASRRDDDATLIATLRDLSTAVEALAVVIDQRRVEEQGP